MVSGCRTSPSPEDIIAALDEGALPGAEEPVTESPIGTDGQTDRNRTKLYRGKERQREGVL